jgi:probable selenium-dependent hydroxylase accessory protein YqeC
VTRAAALLDLLDARSGIVCAVGAGGKKTVLQQLAARHPGRVALTATVVTPPFPAGLGFGVAIAAEAALPARIAALEPARGVVYACPSDKPDRLGGVSPGLIERIHEEFGFAATYVKADGARMRWIKAPEADEPVLPSGCTRVVAVVSARALGEPLGPRVAHRLARLQEITGLATGERIRPEHVGRLLASPLGLRKGAGARRRIVPLINMVDDREREALAREAAEAALELEPAIGYVVLACLQRTEDPVVAVVRR